MINKFFPLPPTPVCSDISYGGFLGSLANDGIVPESLSSNMTNDDSIKCCDFF